MKKNDILNIIKEMVENDEGKKLDNKIISFEVRNDYDGDVEDLINAISATSEFGHSFEIIVDPGDSNYEKKFYIDGDGGTTIKNIKIESLDKGDIEESVFLIDPDDDNLQTKVKAIKNDSNVFDPKSDTIKIKDDGDEVNMTESKKPKSSMRERILTKKDIDNMILERKYNGKLFTKEEILKKLKKD